jgi:hypothetical protein
VQVVVIMATTRNDADAISGRVSSMPGWKRWQSHTGLVQVPLITYHRAHPLPASCRPFHETDTGSSHASLESDISLPNQTFDFPVILAVPSDRTFPKAYLRTRRKSMAPLVFDGWVH